MDPNQIRTQLSRSWSPEKSSGMPAQAFSQVMWQTIIKECLSFEGMGSEGLGGGIYGDWAKEGFSAAIAAQLAQQNPLPMPLVAGEGNLSPKS